MKEGKGKRVNKAELKRMGGKEEDEQEAELDKT